MNIISIIGWTGTITIVLAFYLVSRGKVHAKGYVYHTMNAIGALLISVDAITHSVWSVVGLQATWLVIACIAMVARAQSGKIKN